METDVTESAASLSKTTIVLLAVLPVSLLFLVIGVLDFCLYRRRKVASRVKRSDHCETLRIGLDIITDTCGTSEHTDHQIESQRRLSADARKLSLKKKKLGFHKLGRDNRLFRHAEEHELPVYSIKSVPEVLLTATTTAESFSAPDPTISTN